MADPNAPIFNDDLLANEGDRGLAAARFPDVFGALHFPSLVEQFLEYDRVANEQKRASARAGTWAVLLGAFALVVASSEPLIHASMGEHGLGALQVAADTGAHGESSDHGSAALWLRVAGLAAALAGVASVVIGVRGLLRRGAKRTWMESRLCTERLRQLHFQILCARLPSALSSLSGGRVSAAFERERERALAGFVQDYERHQAGHLDKILSTPRTFDSWMLPVEPIEAAALDETLVGQIMDAYDRLRFGHQVTFAHKKLAGLRIRESVLKFAGLALIGIIVLIHAALAASLLFPAAPSIGGVASSPLSHLAIIWCAILALALRALEDGLGVEEERERYEEYAEEVGELQQRFRAASNLAEKRRAMLDMETVTVGEMKDFLRGVGRATFLL